MRAKRRKNPKMDQSKKQNKMKGQNEKQSAWKSFWDRYCMM